MTRRTKMLTVTAFSLIFSFLMVGYAAITTSLEILGTANATPPNTVFITNVVVHSTTPTEDASGTVNSYTGTVLNSSVKLTSQSDSQVTFEITVYNNSGVVQGFNGIRYSTEAYDNENIVITVDEEDLQRKTIDENDKIQGTQLKPGESLTFKATYAHKNGSSIDPSKLELNSIVNYEFLPFDSIVPGVVDSGLAKDIMEHFEDVLNEEIDVEVDGENGEKVTVDAFEYLDDQMRNDTSGRNSTYIANFSGAKDEDKEVLSAIFGDNFTMNINGTDVTVQVIIKREDVTGDGVADYTIYMTTHSLLQKDAESTGQWIKTYYASPIYAAVYTSETQADGSKAWSMIGQMYTGRGQLNDYSGWPGEGSFNTGTWRSTVQYGGAAVGSDIETVLEKNGLSN